MYTRCDNAAFANFVAAISRTNSNWFEFVRLIAATKLCHSETDFHEINRVTRNYLCESMSSLEAHFPDCGLILLGDFNKLNLSRVANAFGVKQVVPFPTRGQSKLDLVFTNLNAYYDTPRKLPPFGLSDHATVEVQPLEREKLPSQKIVLQSRDLRATNRLAMRTYLEEVDVCSLVDSLVSCQEKTDTLETVIKTGMDILLPLTPKIVMSNDPHGSTSR